MDAHLFALLDEEGHLNFEPRFEHGGFGHASAGRVSAHAFLGFADGHLDVRRKLHADWIAVELLHLHDQVVDEQEAIVAEQLGPQRQRVERFLIHEIQARAVGVEIRRVDHDEIGLVEFLAGLERLVEDRTRHEIAHFDADERLPAARGRPRYLDVEDVIRRPFVLEEHLPLDIDCFDERCHSEDFTL